MHLKNFSLIEEEKISYILTPAYDLLSVNLILEEDTEETALTLCGEKAKLSYATSLQLGQSIGIAEVVARNLIKRSKGLEPAFRKVIEKSFIADEMKICMRQLVSERIQRLSPQ